MKKRICMLLTLILAASLLFGCTGPVRPDVPSDPAGTSGQTGSTAAPSATKNEVLSQKERDALLKELDKYFDIQKLDDEDRSLFDRLFKKPSNGGVYHNAGPVMEAVVDSGYYEFEPKTGEYVFPEDCPVQPSEWPLIYFKDFNTEEYAYYPENGFNSVIKTPLSTFAADVDTGSYTNLRRVIREGNGIDNIPAGLLRYEEMINYFDYQISQDADHSTVPDGRFLVGYRLGKCPWNNAHSLLMMTLKAKEVQTEEAPGNYVFLIDVSGSMAEKDKIELAVKSFALFTKTLGEKDKVSVVTYAGSSDTLLDSCPANDSEKIFEALKKAEAYCVNWGGGTNGSGGITAAYQIAEKNLVKGGNNRVIIASDGDMNLGITGTAGLVELITKEKEKGIFLTTLGFGTGNYSDTNMEQIADAGNGNYYYIDCIDEAQRVLVDKVRETTVTVAKDVKFQVEFNPREVAEYRLIGYENRVMSADDFENDQKDGGEVGAGQAVTVLYEIVPADAETAENKLRYQDSVLSDRAESGEIGTLAIRYKEPDKDTSTLTEYLMSSSRTTLSAEDFLFASAVVTASLVINQSVYLSEATLDLAITMADRNAGEDKARKDFVSLMRELKLHTEWENVKEPTIVPPTDD